MTPSLGQANYLIGVSNGHPTLVQEALKELVAATNIFYT